ncbi:MAG: corrinoid protein [Dehalococcoidia bacterium]|nr:corrinoid protein [Dehalococcoidia bacterium]
MISKKRTREILKGLYDAVVAYDEKASAELSQAALDEGVDAYEAVMNGLAAGMKQVGQLYARQEYFVPELLLCADALYAGLEILRPHIKSNVQETKLKIVMGTVEGDIHDIGKNLVKIMFDAAGWTVYDLGRDVKIERFAEEQKRTASDVVALSALMTTSMLAMPRIVELVKKVDPNVAIMVGGAPLTLEIAKSYGADGYASNAGEAVQETIKVIAGMKKE